MRGRYLVRNLALAGGLGAVDTLLSVPLAFRKRGAPREISPQRVLLSVGGHLGDAVIASAALPLIAEVWPEANIGLLLGSWSRPVMEGHALVKWIHTLDHWKLARGSRGRARKVRRYLQTRGTALREITRIDYDVGVDLYPFFPNTIPLLWQAKIPLRVGYLSGGFGAMLTHATPWARGEGHMAERHRLLLSSVDPRFAQIAPLGYSLPMWDPLPEASSPTGLSGDYLVLHMGAGLRHKEWPLERWRVLADHLRAEGHTLAFTGSGGDQAEDARRVIGAHSGCHNLCDRLSWTEFVRTLAGAQAVITVDSVAGHIASGVGAPVVVLMSGMNEIDEWRPLGDRTLPITHPVPCATCHRGRGCAEMTCVRGIDVAEVLALVRTALAGRRR